MRARLCHTVPAAFPRAFGARRPAETAEEERAANVPQMQCLPARSRVCGASCHVAHREEDDRLSQPDGILAVPRQQAVLGTDRTSCACEW